MNQQLVLSVNEFPSLAKLITGQKAKLILDVNVGMRVTGASDDVLSFIIDKMEIKLPEKRYSAQEVLLARIDEKLGMMSSPSV